MREGAPRTRFQHESSSSPELAAPVVARRLGKKGSGMLLYQSLGSEPLPSTIFWRMGRLCAFAGSQHNQGTTRWRPNKKHNKLRSIVMLSAPTCFRYCLVDEQEVIDIDCTAMDEALDPHPKRQLNAHERVARHSRSSPTPCHCISVSMLDSRKACRCLKMQVWTA